jgi:Putative Ig domain
MLSKSGFQGLLSHIVIILALPFLLNGCATSPDSSKNSNSSTPLGITTSSLPNGQIGTVYSAMLVATGGTTPYTWSLTSGTLPAGLALNGSTGAIAGTPTAAVNSTPLTFKVTDSSSPALTQSASLTLTISPASLVITTSSLPNGQVGAAYTATLMATGGTTPYTWSLTSGTLPTGLSLNASSGAITGTPTATATSTPLTFEVTDSSNPVRTQSVNLTLTISASGITVSISPQRAALTVMETLSTLTATTNDSAGVTWSISPSGSNASFSPSTSLSGAKVTFTAPSAAGVYTITAKSVTDITASSSITVGVTDLAGVYTYHNDLARDGVNGQEYALTTSSVSTSTFGKLFACTVDGAIYAQPLWVANLTVNSAKHNVVFVATQHDSLYAFDADANPCVQLWKVSLIDTSHGGTTGETTVPSGVPGYLVGQGAGDITPEVGVTGTPVIDPSTNTLYVVSKSVNQSGPTTFYQRLHGIDITTGNEKFSGPATIGITSSSGNINTSSITFPGTGDGGSSVTFNAQQENQRAGLALVNGVVYVAWASHEDTPPWYGWVVGFNASNLAVTSPAGTYTPAWTFGSSNGWFAGVAAFKPAPSGGGPVTFRQSATAYGAIPSGGTYGLAYNSNNLTGDLLLAYFNVPKSSSSISSVTDSNGNTWNPVFNVSESTIGGSDALYYAYNAKAGANTVTVHFSGSTSHVDMSVFEYSGILSTANPLDVSANNQGSGTSASASITTTASGDLIFTPLSIQNPGTPPTVPSGYTLRVSDIYDFAADLIGTNVLNVTPNVQYGGIWMGGGAPSADNSNNLYVITGNAKFDVTNGSAPNNDYGDSFLQLSPNLSVSSYFTPSDQATDDADDYDFGAGGAAVVLNVTSGSLKHLVIGGGKDGSLYLLNGDSMGGSGDSNARQHFNIGNGIYATGAFWNNNFYIAGQYSPLISYSFNSSTNLFNTSIASSSSTSYGFPGATPSVSSTGSSNGIVWALDNTSYCTNQSPSCGPAILHAYNATSLASELWNSSKVSGDAAGNAVKFTVPTVANGKVYVGTRGNNTGGVYGSTTVSGELDVYGLKPN